MTGRLAASINLPSLPSNTAPIGSSGTQAQKTAPTPLLVPANGIHVHGLCHDSHSTTTTEATMSIKQAHLSRIQSITALHNLGCTPVQIACLMSTAKQLARLSERQCAATDEKQEAAAVIKMTKLISSVEYMLKGLPVVIYRQTDPRGMPLYIIPKEVIPESVSVDAIYNKGIAVYYE